ncbi:MAG: FAD-binding oxidoreductase [Vicinamibacterales bacterium]
MPPIQARPAARVAVPPVETDPDIVGGYLEDAAHYPGGAAVGVARPSSADEVAAIVGQGQPVLAVGAQSSLTGGATPAGGVVLSTARLQALDVDAPGRRVRAGAGVTLAALQERLAADGLWFPPVPTYLGATVGGAVSTNAAGAATFKYGAVRPWVDALTVVLASGDVLEIARGTVAADDAGFAIGTSRGEVRVPIAPLPLPDVPKRSAGYPLAAGMDLVDLFIGAEGTLGVVTDATLRVAPLAASTCWAFVPVADEPRAIALAGELRAEARRAWAGAADGLDIAAIEHLDRRSIAIVREDGVDRRLDITLPAGAAVVLLVQIELPPGRPDEALWDDLAAGVDGPATPLGRLCRVLARHGALDDAEVALPGQVARAAAFVELREAVPAGVNRRVAQAQAAIDPRISKTAADMVVPFERFGDMMRECRRLFDGRGLDLAVWGHISDGNVHPNVIPRSAADVDQGLEAILELGRVVIGMGGCPLAEHGVGRNPVKQALLESLYGPRGIAAMRAVRRALDPAGLFARNVLFPA